MTLFCVCHLACEVADDATAVLPLKIVVNDFDSAVTAMVYRARIAASSALIFGEHEGLGCAIGAFGYGFLAAIGHREVKVRVKDLPNRILDQFHAAEACTARPAVKIGGRLVGVGGIGLRDQR